MGKKYIRAVSVLAAMALFFLSSQALYGAAADGTAQTDELRIEGVTAVMPEMKIYCYKEQEFPGTVSISYGGEPLAVNQILPYEKSGEHTDYYVLLDISASVSTEYFSGMKESILELAGSMASEDEISLITFGDEVDVVFTGKTAADDIEEAVLSLENTDQSTLLFDAVNQTAKLADTRQNADSRRIMLILTDGEDFSENTSTKNEALQTLQEKGLPLYAMAAREIYGKSNSYLSDMGEFVRSTGGVMEVFDAEDAVLKIRGLKDLFGNAVVIQASAENNLVDYQSKPLTITYDDKTQSTFYTASYYETDAEPPSASARKYSEDAIEIIFSEPVQNAEEISSYVIRQNGKPVTSGYMVRYEEGKNDTVVVTFEEKLKNGEYEIEFLQITDISMEENPLKGTVSFTVTDGISPGVWDYLVKYQALAAGAVVLLVVFCAAFIGWRIIKKRNAIVTVNGETVLASHINKKVHVKVKKKEIPRKQIQFSLEGTLTGNRQFTAEVVNSIIVGRSEICDISIDDERLSRQHFAIYDRDGAFYIEDLHTTNGTLVNGKKISAAVRLAAGDRIEVGEITMIVRW